VHHSFQSVLDHARDRGELSFEVETFRQRAAVEKIIDRIGKDTPLEIVNRLPSYYQRVHTCVRYDDEQPSKFATRFRGLASEYMSLAGVSATDQESQLMGMVMLQNARLPQDTQNAVKLQLVTQGQQKAEAPVLNPLELRQSVAGELQKKLDEVEELVATAGTLNVETDGSPGTVRTFTDSEFATVSTSLEAYTEKRAEELKRDTVQYPLQRSGNLLFVDDVYNALKSLDSSKKHSSKKKEGPTDMFSTDDFEKAVQKATMMAIRSHGKAPLVLGKEVSRHTVLRLIERRGPSATVASERGIGKATRSARISNVRSRWMIRNILRTLCRTVQYRRGCFFRIRVTEASH